MLRRKARCSLTLRPSGVGRQAPHYSSNETVLSGSSPRTSSKASLVPSARSPFGVVSVAVLLPYLMSTLKRLSDEDVKAVFRCLHHGSEPPAHLHFQIVPVGPRGLRLSPPSHEFEDGLYVLLRPHKTKKNGSADVPPPRAPEHLAHMLMRQLPPETCPWSLSGPQFPMPTPIQQRYCYPKGRAEYSSRKGGALWTMYGSDGKEDAEFRLLHVYLSPKRAANQGVQLSQHEHAVLRHHNASVASNNKRLRGLKSKDVGSGPSSRAAFGPGARGSKTSRLPAPTTAVSYSSASATVGSPPSLSPLSMYTPSTPQTNSNGQFQLLASHRAPSEIRMSSPSHHETASHRPTHGRSAKHPPPHPPGPPHHPRDRSAAAAAFVTPSRDAVHPAHPSTSGGGYPHHHRRPSHATPPHRVTLDPQKNPFRNRPLSISQQGRRYSNHMHHPGQDFARPAFLDDPHADPFWDEVGGIDPFDGALADGTGASHSPVSSLDIDDARPWWPVETTAGYPSQQPRHDVAHHTHHWFAPSTNGGSEAMLRHPYEPKHRRHPSSTASMTFVMGVTADPHGPPLATEALPKVGHKALLQTLVETKQSLAQCIERSAEAEQASMVSLVVGWANQLARDPLSTDDSEPAHAAAPAASVQPREWVPPRTDRSKSPVHRHDVAPLSGLEAASPTNMVAEILTASSFHDESPSDGDEAADSCDRSGDLSAARPAKGPKDSHLEETSDESSPPSFSSTPPTTPISPDARDRIVKLEDEAPEQRGGTCAHRRHPEDVAVVPSQVATV